MALPITALLSYHQVTDDPLSVQAIPGSESMAKEKQVRQRRRYYLIYYSSKPTLDNFLPAVHNFVYEHFCPPIDVRWPIRRRIGHHESEDGYQGQDT